jgi:CheY-like chemotaxis protein
MTTLNIRKHVSFTMKTERANGSVDEVARNERTPLIAREEIAQTQQSLGRILVVDDNKDAADALGNLFRALGYDTVVAYNGTEGMSVFNETHPRFAFLDIAMPDISGYDLAQRIREKAGAEVILIAVTGFGQVDDKARALEAGFDYHLTKPIGLSQVQSILAKHGNEQTGVLEPGQEHTPEG